MKKINISNYNTLLFFLINSCFIGIASSNLYTLSKQDSWLSIIISFILGFSILYIYYYIIKKYPNKSIVEILDINYNKYINSFIKIIMLIFLLLFSTVIFYNLINFINTQFLYKTPNTAISIMFGICLYYLLHKDIVTICRTSTILFYIFILLYISTFIGLLPQVNMMNFLPIFHNSSESIFLGSLNIIVLNISPLFLLTIIPYNNINNKEKLIKNSIIFYILGFISIFIMNFFVNGIYGTNLAQIMQYPEFNLLKRLSLIGFLERVEKVLFIQWIFSLILVIVTTIYFAKQIILKYISKNSNNNWIIDISLIIILIIGVLNIFKNNIIANDFYLKVLPILCFIFFILMPFILFIKIKKKYASN